jgi:hypothetical protein
MTLPVVSGVKSTPIKRGRKAIHRETFENARLGDVIKCTGKKQAYTVQVIGYYYDVKTRMVQIEGGGIGLEIIETKHGGPKK